MTTKHHLCALALATAFSTTAAFSSAALAQQAIPPSSTYPASQATAPRSLGLLPVPLHATRSVQVEPVVGGYARSTHSTTTLPIPATFQQAQPRVLHMQPVVAYDAVRAPAAVAPTSASPAPTPTPDYLIFAGSEVSGQNGKYGNVGAIGAIGNTHFGNGPVWRVMTDALGYSYVGGPSNSTIDGSAYAGEASLGYIKSFQGGTSIAGYLGGVYRNTNLSPNDPGNKLSGGQWGFKTQAETTFYATQDWRTNLQAAYVFGPDNWWTRGSTQVRTFNSFFVGPEIVWQGDNTYKAWQIGGLLNGIHLSPTSELGFRAGYKKIQDLSGTIYGGLEFSTMF